MTNTEFVDDTIVAQATPSGRGGVGIIRISGPLADKVATVVLHKIPEVRKAEYLPFYENEDTVLDQGIVLFFKAPNSFTGEDVLELHGHGGPVIIDLLLKRIAAIEGIRFARPGEFSERAFLNDKIDLAQAEAIADLIDATSEQAARSAIHSLQGDFSKQVNTLVESIIQLRMYVEAAIDFPEEEIDFLSDGKVANDLAKIISNLNAVNQAAQQGSIIREGMRVVIAGKPNAGKSSLLNALAGREAAIVTDIAGTTRDVLREHIHIDGMPLHIIDTAGLREDADTVEQIGIERAWDEINNADRVILMVDGTTTKESDPHQIWPEFFNQLPASTEVTIIRNKADKTGETVGITTDHQYPVLHISAKNYSGIELVREHLKECMGFKGCSETTFIARSRHLVAINKASEHLLIGQQQLENFVAGEILAEELRLTQQYLNEITGEFSNDDLLGKIFSSFCIGK